MFTQKFKLICSVIGLVAVPGATQQTQLSRSSILNAIQTAMGAQLTAAVGEQLALDAAVFFSNYEGSTWAFIPPRFLKQPYQTQRSIQGEEEIHQEEELRRRRHLHRHPSLPGKT